MDAMRLVHACYEIGTWMLWNWNMDAMRLVHGCYEIGTWMLWDWNLDAMKSVHVLPCMPSQHISPTVFERWDFYMLMYYCLLSPTHIPWYDVSILKQALVSTVRELTDATDRVLLFSTYNCSPTHLIQQCSILSLSICKYTIHMSE